MKKLLFALLAFPLFALSQTEQYYVTFLKGTVVLQRTKLPLKPGDKILAEDKLIFKDKTCKLNCISPGKGRFEISATQGKANEEGELLAVLKSSLLPVANTYHLSTRAFLFEGYDPKTYFRSEETNNRILLLSDQALPVNGTYKLAAGNFFFVQYQLNGKTITRKVDQNEQGLQFKPELFIDGTSHTEKAMLCYQSKESGTARSSVLAEFIPVLSNTTEIKEQIKLISKFSGITNPINLNAEITSHIYANYGKIGLETLSTLGQ
ncbi:MAG: hypothetical protein RLY89_2210 [Bacteroidota bacterium]|jgi:hypothetical protein